MRKIGIIGAGNLGHYIAAKLGRENEIYIFTRDTENWSSEVTAIDITGKRFIGRVKEVSADSKKIVGKCEILFVTWPTHIVARRMSEIAHYIKEGAWICFCPGYGGKEFICEELIERGVHIIGIQRVFSSTKIINRGREVQCIDNRPCIQMGSVIKDDRENGRRMLEELYHKPCIVFDNYLNITLTPSNPVLHTARLYSLFKDYWPGKIYDRQLSFYSEWNDDSSYILLGIDREVQSICAVLEDLDLQGVRSLKKHYEIADVSGKNDCERMTKKIKSLKFLKDLAPMKAVDGGFVPDLNARYFHEDFAFGLYVIRDFARILKLKTPQMDEIIEWHEQMMREIPMDDYAKVLPREHGISSQEDILKYYTR